MSAFAKYFAVFKTSWQFQLEYRFDTLIRFGIVSISLFTVIFLWNDIYGQQVFLAYTKQQMATYYALCGYFALIFASVPIAQEIQEGTLSTQLVRPISYLWFHYAQSLAKRLFRLILGFPVLSLLFFVFQDQFYLPTTFSSYLILILTCFGAINLLFLFDVLLGLIEFWLTHSDAISSVTDPIFSFMNGAYLPLFLLPAFFQNVSEFLPFKYTTYFLIDAFLGGASSEHFVFGLTMQTLWTGVLALIVLTVWQRGVARYEAFGV